VVGVMVTGLSFVKCRRQKPRQDEIERVKNSTHSVIWKCSLSECQLGWGFSVLCGTSVSFNVSLECVQCEEGLSYSDTQDYSPCKRCRVCSENEERSGKCTVEEDTTKCLRTCRKGFYWDDLTDSCHPCSDCCGENLKHHEEQCENAGLSFTHQCRQTYFKCEHPTTASYDEKQVHPDDAQQGSLSWFEIAVIVFSVIFLFVIITLVVMWRLCGWQTVKTKLKNCLFCKCFESSANRNTVHFNNEIFDENDLESSTWRESEIHLEEKTDKIGSLKSAPPVLKKPLFQRLCSVPVEPSMQLKSKPEILRSYSHPGCLKNTDREPVENKPSTPKKCVGQRTKRVDKKLYISVPTVDPAMCHFTDQDPGVEREKEPRKQSPPNPHAKDQFTSTTGLHHSSSINLASVPQDFQTQLLSGKMATIPIKFYRKICVKLDTSRGCFWDDNRLFGEKIGLNRDEIMFLGQQENTTHLMIQKFASQKDSSIGKFKKIMAEMERDDIVSIVSEWIVNEWITRCNSSLAALV